MEHLLTRLRAAGFVRPLITLLALLLAGGLAMSSRAAENESDDVLVRVQAGTDANVLAADYSTTVRDHVENSNLYALNVPAGTTAVGFAAVLAADPRVFVAEQDAPVDAQIHVAFDGNRHPGAYVNQAAYRMVDAGNVGAITQGDGVIVAVLDTGVALDHPALQGHLITGENEVSPGTAPQDVKDGTTNVAAGHGTMIAGLIARLAPKASIMPVRVLNGDGTGSLLNVVKGVQFALSHGARVINISFGTTQQSDALEQMLDDAENAGAVVVASAGNDGSTAKRYPAAAENAISVASVNVNGKKSPFSNYGPTVTVSAPGNSIRSTYLDGGYATWSGTSVAVPFVSSAAALMLAAQPTNDTGSVSERIRKTAHSVDAQNPKYRGLLGGGVIDIKSAVLSHG